MDFKLGKGKLYNEKRFTPLKTNVEPEFLVHFRKGKHRHTNHQLSGSMLKFGGQVCLPAPSAVKSK